MNSSVSRLGTNNRWCRVGPYEFTHPDGWTITNRIVRRKPVWTLQLGYRSEGSFPSPADAMERHAQLADYMPAGNREEK